MKKVGKACISPVQKQRRKGNDRRKYIDPRYRNPAYPEFCDRRKAQRRKPEYETCQPLVEEHPSKRWITVIGLAAALFLIYASVLANVGVDTKLVCQKKGTLSSYLELPRLFNCSF